MLKLDRRLAAFLVAATLLSCSPQSDEAASDGDEKETGNEPPALVVRVVKPRRGVLEDRMEITARVEAYEKADVLPRLEGVVTKVHAVEGETVKRGQLLAEIEDEEHRITVQSRRLAVEQAVLAVNQARFSVEEQENRAAAQKTTLDKEIQNLERAKSQHAQGIVPDKELEDAQYAYDTAHGEVERLTVERNRMAEDLKVKEIMQKDAENQLRQAELTLSWTKFRATIDGRITQRHIRLGQKATPGTAAYSIADFASLVIEPTVPEKELAVMKVGLPVAMSSTAHGNREFRGTVEYISPEVDTTGGSVMVRIRIEKTDPPLLPGMFVSGRIVTEERDNVLLIPKKALLFDRERPYIYALDRGDENIHVKKVYIERGLQNATEIEYRAPSAREAQIDDDSEIVLVGLDRLFDNAIVEVDGESEDDEADEESGADDDEKAEKTASAPGGEK